MTLYAVLYASAGCLPDSDEPEFIGTLDQCQDWLEANEWEYERADVAHDLYSLSIEEWGQS